MKSNSQIGIVTIASFSVGQEDTLPEDEALNFSKFGHAKEGFWINLIFRIWSLIFGI